MPDVELFTVPDPATAWFDATRSLWLNLFDTACFIDPPRAMVSKRADDDDDDPTFQNGCFA